MFHILILCLDFLFLFFFYKDAKIQSTGCSNAFDWQLDVYTISFIIFDYYDWVLLKLNKFYTYLNTSLMSVLLTSSQQLHITHPANGLSVVTNQHKKQSAIMHICHL